MYSKTSIAQSQKTELIKQQKFKSESPNQNIKRHPILRQVNSQFNGVFFIFHWTQVSFQPSGRIIQIKQKPTQKTEFVDKQNGTLVFKFDSNTTSN